MNLRSGGDSIRLSSSSNRPRKERWRDVPVRLASAESKQKYARLVARMPLPQSMYASHEVRLVLASYERLVLLHLQSMRAVDCRAGFGSSPGIFEVVLCVEEVLEVFVRFETLRKASGEPSPLKTQGTATNVDMVRVRQYASEYDADDRRSSEESEFGVPRLDTVRAVTCGTHHVTNHDRNEEHVRDG